ncbi:hypothetical protein NQ314_014708 [Rhamnusium bicolor]|uniref:PiggyBac transposable element-derived protein domain-containing protein n=1 Tax=Rhamnusium bicolor TaxID=1586634 RepID=A0AAV8X0V2_9CUCU|nr:hypothetical protein NQ314_014708 [Rhamnusium bicolor]
MLNENFEKFKEPNKYIAVDETMVPFRGRLSFRQYISSKRHKYGIKLIKVSDTDAYTHRVEIYQGKSITKGENLTKLVVLRPCEAYLNKGRTIVTDNFYTGMELASELLDKNTHLIGTLRKNRRGLPKEVTSTKLKKGEIVGREDPNGIVILKWRDQRDVYRLSTCHTLDKIATGKKNRKNEDIVKPQFIVDYNMGKAGIAL